MISRMSGGPVGRRHSLFAPTDPMMGKRSHQDLPETMEEDEEDHSNEGDSETSSSRAGSEKEDCILTFNIGGRTFQTYRRTLMKVPNTRLALVAQITPDSMASNETFFDRNPEMFAAILSFYRDDTLHVPRNVCAMAFCKELEFWGLNETWLSNCCQKQYNDTIGELHMSARMRTEFSMIKAHRVASSPEFLLSRRGQMWEFLDNPSSSLFAKIWFLFFYLAILLSVVLIFASTHPGCRVDVHNPFFDAHNHTDELGTQLGDFLIHQAEENPKVRRLLTTRSHGAVILMELFCAIYFTLEFALRAVICPHKRLLFRRYLTWCDLLYLIPLWCELFTSYAAYRSYTHPNMLPLKLVLKTLMVFRVVRIFALAKYYRALRVLLLSIRASMKEIFLLLCFVMFAMVIFASCVYCAEIFREDSYFDHLFTGLWWSLITMTTVGYGDTYPQSWAGYLVGAACALTGIIIIGMPVPIITSNFHLYYSFQSLLDEETLKAEEEEEESEIDEAAILSSRRNTTTGRRHAV